MDGFNLIQVRRSAGRRKKTSSRVISTSWRSPKPSSASRATTRSTKTSGEEAPAVSPTVPGPSSPPPAVLVPLEPALVEIGLVVDEVCLGTPVVRDLDEAVRVRARL